MKNIEHPDFTMAKLAQIYKEHGRTYHADTCEALVRAAEAKILKKPTPIVAVSELGDSSVNFVVRPWVKPADYWDVYFDVTEKLKLSLETNGLTIPFQQFDVNVRNKTD